MCKPKFCSVKYLGLQSKNALYSSLVSVGLAQRSEQGGKQRRAADLEDTEPADSIRCGL